MDCRFGMRGGFGPRGGPQFGRGHPYGRRGGCGGGRGHGDPRIGWGFPWTGIDIEILDDDLMGFVQEISRRHQDRCDSSQEECGKTCGKKSGGRTECMRMKKNKIDPYNTIVLEKDGKWTVSIPLGEEVKPGDLSVTVKDRNVVIEIRSEKTSEDGTSHLRQVFRKKVSLPDGVNVDEVKSTLTPEGVLKVQVSLPAPAQLPTPQSLEIPIVIETEEPSAPAEK